MVENTQTVWLYFTTHCRIQYELVCGIGDNTLTVSLYFTTDCRIQYQPVW
jgi:hypothetical protein